ncbi:MAG: hypothetical protein ACYDAD_10005, partial [Acidimicrobiales bacterium]
QAPGSSGARPTQSTGSTSSTQSTDSTRSGPSANSDRSANQAPVRVSVSVLDEGRVVPVPDLTDAPVLSGLRRAFRLGAHIQHTALPLLVTADRPIVFERDLYPTPFGTSDVIGIPIP